MLAKHALSQLSYGPSLVREAQRPGNTPAVRADPKSCSSEEERETKAAAFRALRSDRDPTRSDLMFQAIPKCCSKPQTLAGSSLERRRSSRRFPYGYLVTTSPQSLTLPWLAASLRLAHHLRVKPTPMV